MKAARPARLSKTLALVPPTVALMAQHASGAFDAYMKIGDIKGEATEPKHLEWVELKSVQWGVARAISSPTSGSQREASNPSFSEVTVAKDLDRSSPAIFLQAVSTGTPIPTVTLDLVDGASGAVFYRLTLVDVLVSSQSQSAMTGDGKPQESVSLNFAKIEIEYFGTSKDGSTGTSKVSFDLTKNTSKS